MEYRHLVGILQWIALVRADLQFPSKELARGLSSPTSKDWSRLRRVGKYLVTTRKNTHKMHLDRHAVMEIGVASDSNWLGDDGRATSGFAVDLMTFSLSTGSMTQAIVSRSAPEAELYGLCTAVSRAMFVQTILKEIFEKELPIHVYTDSSSALGIIGRIGVGKLTHIQVKF